MLTKAYVYITEDNGENARSFGWRNKFINFYHKWTITRDNDILFFKIEEAANEENFK